MFFALAFALPAIVPAADPAYATLDQAYAALRSRDYDTAVSLFRSGLVVLPQRNDVRKDLAYTLLKAGETAAARDHFLEVTRRDPADFNAALEFAFLAYETGQQVEARRMFDRVRKSGDKASRMAAEQAFQNVDRPLAEGIARWRDALSRTPDNYSAHHELALLATQREEWALALEHLSHAWRLKPSERSVLLDLGRCHQQLGQAGRSMASLLAASRGAQPRTAESARALLPSRYPYVYEFRLALELDPGNVNLRRELAYLLLEMGQRQEAEIEFDRIVREQPEDLLSHAQLGFLKLARRDLIEEARRMAEKSYEAGYLNDAMKYLTIAHEHDPMDFGVILRLGQTENLRQNDKEALQWFSLARKAPDERIAREANRAYHNLRPRFARVQASFWAFPFYSSRWQDAFSYAQGKVEFNLPSLPFRPYMSLRFIGDLRGSIRDPYPQYLTETALIPAVGVATRNYHGAFAWAEAGVSVSYLRRADQTSRMTPDYRAGISYSFAKGGAKYFDHHDDLIWVSRFGNTLLLYTQNKFGMSLGEGFKAYWNLNFTLDTQRQYWANTAETGPGLRWRAFSVDLLRGAHLVNAGNPRRPNYTDVRAGVWYAFRR